MLEMNVNGRVGSTEICFGMSPARSVVLVGPSGAGKSTVLRMLLGLSKPTSGRIIVNNEPLFDREEGIDVPTERRKLGYLPQNYALFPRMTVEDNVAFGLECMSPRPKRRQRRERAMTLLEELELCHLAKRSPRDLSGGEAQRVALARALAPSPEALILDEPMAALDLATREQVRSFLSAYLTKKALLTIAVSHDPADAAWLGEHIVFLDKGRVVQQGTLQQLRASCSGFLSRFVDRALAEGSGRLVGEAQSVLPSR